MLPITVEFIKWEGDVAVERSGWKVIQGEASADCLTWDEMLGVFISLTIRECPSFPGLQWMKTAEQRAGEERRRAAQLELRRIENETKE